MAAGVSDSRQSVVFSADGDMHRTVAGAGGESGRKIADPSLDLEAQAVQKFANPVSGVFFLESELRFGMDSVAQVDQIAVNQNSAFLAREPFAFNDSSNRDAGRR